MLSSSREKLQEERILRKNFFFPLNICLSIKTSKERVKENTTVKKKNPAVKQEPFHKAKAPGPTIFQKRIYQKNGKRLFMKACSDKEQGFETGRRKI